MKESAARDNPWQTTETTTRFENPWMRVIENAVVHPNGTKGHYTVVHFKNRAVAVIPIDAFDHTWLVGQFRYPHDSYEWEIPEGGCTPGEEPADCARRELAEETGLTAGDLELILEMQLSNSVTDEVSFTYVARDLIQGAPSPDPSEQLALRRLPVDDAIAMAVSGEIRDALSVASLLKLAALRGRDWRVAHEGQGIRENLAAARHSRT